MAMLTPTHRNRSFINGFFSDPFEPFFSGPTFASKTSSSLMKTDIRETEDAFHLATDLPGFNKEDVQVQLKNGYLSIQAKTTQENQEGSEDGTFLRKERFSGSCNRSFYVGEDIVEDAISASFENGVLSITVPKLKEQPKLEEGRTIAIA